MGSKTYYARHRIEAIAGTIGFLLTALAAHSHGANGLAITLAVTAVLVAAFVLRRPRLRIDGDGLVVANLLHTYRVGWAEITAFGFDPTASTPSLTIRRRDGTVVHAVVVNDNYRSGYSEAQVDAIIADLQDRLAAANGTTVNRALDKPARIKPARARLTLVAWFIVCLFFLVLGAIASWNAAEGLPKTYSRLDAHGAHETATFAGCRVVDVRQHECRLTLAGRTWTYSEDYPQFNGLAAGNPVAVLVDAKHPTTVYTAHDVAVRYDAGFGPLAILGIVFAAGGFLGLVFLLWLQHLAGAARRKLSGERPPSGPSPVVES